MKILFDIRKGTGGRSYGYSLNVNTLISVNGEKKAIGDMKTLNGIPAARIHSIVKEFNETGCLTNENLAFVKNSLHNKGIIIDQLNDAYEEY